MTKGQRLRYKMGNAIRRNRIITAAKENDPTLRYYWAGLKIGQRGKYGRL